MHPVTAFRHKRKARIIEYLGGVCVVCGTTQELEIDHIDPSLKSFVLNGNNLNRTWEFLLPEIKKCQLLCNAHHIEKSRQEQLGKAPWNKGISLLSPDSHGNWQAYDKRACRCEICKAWKKNYRKKLVDSWGNPLSGEAER